MKKYLMIVALGLMLMAMFCGTSIAWQGRMAGMGDPYGLVHDESDFLIHPALISNGDGFKVYSHYRFTHTEVTRWDFDVESYAGGLLYDYVYNDVSGSRHDHEALLGTAFPLKPGRLGIFLSYNGKREDYNGDIENWTTSDFDLDSDIDDFSFRFIYGLPVGCLNLGAEASIGYRQEENMSYISIGTTRIQNYPRDLSTSYRQTFNYLIPYDSDYWEALFKGSVSGCIGPVETLFTLHGGFIFAGDNDWDWNYHTPFNEYGGKAKGDVDGWKAGGDLWLRYPIGNGWALPFLVSAVYQEKTRDGDFSEDFSWDYKHKEKSLSIEAGGGVERERNSGPGLAAGVYYGYFQHTDELWEMERYPATGDWAIHDYSDYPEYSEHRVTVKLAAEHQLTPSVLLTTGVNCFYGWIEKDFEYDRADSVPLALTSENIAMDGDRWGITASVGASILYKSFTLEPFIYGGYQDLNLDGDGDQDGPILQTDLEIDEDRTEWFIGAGLSVLFGN